MVKADFSFAGSPFPGRPAGKEPAVVEFVQKDRYDIQDLLEVVRLLRAPGGCPWDRAQTHQSIRANFLEETYEAVDAIDLADPALLREELGDVLLQVLLHCQMEAETGTFDFTAVCDELCKKLIYRHPHVFGDAPSGTPGQVLNSWNSLKNKEKGRATARAELDSVPAALPALMRAAKLQKRAAGHGVPAPDAAAALAGLEARAAAARRALARGEAPDVGGLLFETVALARAAGVEPEEALTRAGQAFTARVEAAEDAAQAAGVPLSRADEAMRAGCWPAVQDTQASE